MNIYGNSNDDINDATLTNTTLQGSTNIVCDDNSTYNLQTPDNGDNLEVLTTDGAGNTYWASGGSGNPTFQDVYNNSSNPANVVLVDDKPIIFKDTLDQVAFTISSDGINTQAGGVNGGFYNSQMNTIKRADIGDTKIEVIENIPLTTIRTTFTEDQEFITKKYVDDAIPAPKTLQQVVDVSYVLTRASCEIPYGNFIKFDNPDSANILTIEALGGFNNRITADRAQINFLDTQQITSDIFIKEGGTSNQYLMADGSSLQFSANSGNSNFYLYDSQNGVGAPPIPNGHIEYNNVVQSNATTIYISHLTTDGIDIDIFFAQITTIQDVYIQDKNSSLNFIKYNITGNPTIITNDYIAIPVLYTATIPPAQPNGAGDGLTSFGVNHPVIVSFFTNSIEVDTRLTTLETKTQNITASPSITTIIGTTNINSAYTLPNTAPAIGNVLTCSALGVSSWITPSTAILPSNVVTFTVSGTYTPTVGTKRAQVFVQAGGGGGGGCIANQNNSCGSGGGSGALATGIYIITTGTAAVVVGVGGAVSSGSAGSPGATSSFTYLGSALFATGGQGGQTQNSNTAGSDRYISVAAQTAGSATIPTINAVFAGGYARSGTIGMYGVMLDPNYGTGGNGGASEYGVGGVGATASANNVIADGLVGTLGSGGGGAIQTAGTAVAGRPGGLGAAGLVRIIEYF